MGAVFSAFDDLICERRPSYSVTYEPENVDISSPSGYHVYVVDRLRRVGDHVPDPAAGRQIPDTTIDNINMCGKSIDLYSGQLDIV